MIKTNYGIKKEGKAKFVIVAPHAAGDDINTGPLSRKIASKSNSYLVINDKYVKPTNSSVRIRDNASLVNFLT